MKISSLHSTPRRLFCRRGVSFGSGLVASALVLALLNRAIAYLAHFPTAKTSSVQIKPPQLPSREAKSRDSLATALSHLDAQTVAAYIARWSQPEKTAASRPQRAVFIDAEALARRHPAWRLADEIESGAVSPSSPQIARVVAALQTETWPGKTPASPPQSLAPRAVSSLVFGEKGVSNREISARDSQRNALDKFLVQSAARDVARARDEAFLARRALGESVALAQRGAVAELDVPLLAPDIALELLNLRLELLRNLSRTPVERAATRDQIRAIEARYNALLKFQTDAQAARVRAATIDIPAQTQREGLLRIARDAQSAAQQSAQTRCAFAVETRSKISRDFASGTPLRLALPPHRTLPLSASISSPLSGSSAASQLAPFDFSAPSDFSAAPQFFKTARQTDASKLPTAEQGAISTRNRAQIAAILRQGARRDAARWARHYAAHVGAIWRENAALSGLKAPIAAIPNLTAAALQTIFPARLR